MENQPKHIDNVTRRNLSYFWSVASAMGLGYILIVYGGHIEILTLLIGLIGGTLISPIITTYYGGTMNPQKPTVNQSADTITNSPNVSDTPTAQP